MTTPISASRLDVHLNDLKIADLDPALYRPDPSALEFLHKTITDDDEKLKQRVVDIQKEAYQSAHTRPVVLIIDPAHYGSTIHPFPCILRFAFLRMRMSEHPIYKEVIEAGKSGRKPLLLDLGCCMGTDLRKAVFDGFPAPHAVGCDIFPAFLQLGHKLWNDKDACGIKFIQGDIFALPDTASASPDGPLKLSEVASLDALQGRVDILFTGSVFHLFDEVQQTEMAQKAATLISRNPGSLIFGRHGGKETKGFRRSSYRENMFAHSPESWTALWIDTFTQLESAEFAEKHVVIDAELLSDEPVHEAQSRRVLQWSIRII